MVRAWLKVYREENKLNQEELGKIIGVSRQLIGLLESGKARPSIEVAQKIGSFFGFDWTLFFDKSPAINSNEIKTAKQS